jgi:lipopolysaccharide cholinephosphotransferase
MPSTNIDIFDNVDAAKFKITKPQAVIDIYKLLYILDKIFHQNKLEYWIEGGTMLGAVRHKGIIPWDDDGDVQIWKKDEERLKKLKDVFASYNIVLMPIWFGYKIFFKNGKSITGYKWLYPFVDIFIMENKNGKVSYSYPAAQIAFGKSYFEIATMYPLERYKFGSFELTGVSRNAVNKYFDISFGEDWLTHAYEMYDHENEKSIKRVKRLLNDNEKQPAQPIDFVKF